MVSTLARKFEPKQCERCEEWFIPAVGTQRFCGSKTNKTGCSWQNWLDYDRERNKTPERKSLNLECQKKWKKEQRANNTDYAERQRESKRDYAKNNKEVANLWRRLNTKKIQEWNRARQLKKRGVIGTHTEKEWQELKEIYGYCCAECGISEKELELKFAGTQFVKLTKDHILPLSKGGTDSIYNIKPLCVSCNSSKYNNTENPIVAVSGGMDCLHIGHIRLIQAAAELGDVVVILNNDNWLRMKKGYCFMPQEERAEIMAALKGVKGVIITSHEESCKDTSVAKELRELKPDIFCNGGDRKEGCVPTAEEKICKELGIEMVYGVGGEKIQSSSELVQKAENCRKILGD